MAKVHVMDSLMNEVVYDNKFAAEQGILQDFAESGVNPVHSVWEESETEKGAEIELGVTWRVSLTPIGTPR
jgi:hypothetical protein